MLRLPIGSRERPPCLSDPTTTAPTLASTYALTCPVLLRPSPLRVSLALQGSGWVWLGYNTAAGRVEVTTCANQDPLSITGLVPLLGIDVWEHAYYLQYK